MAVYFLDSSALVKRYMIEAGSQWVTDLTDTVAGNKCWLVSITSVEILSALYRKARTGTHTLATAQLAANLFKNELNTHFRRIAVKSILLDEAMRLVSLYPLQGCDAIQLAAAKILYAHLAAQRRMPPTFVSADQVLNAAAAAEGLSVEDPNQHP